MSQLTPYLKKLFDKRELTQCEASSAMQIILEEANAEQTSAFLSLLKYRGEAPQEIAGILETIEKSSLSIKLPYSVLDIVGTGGDLANTVNISTGSAILAAACGIPVVKHGNKAVSSLCGSADVLEALGINIQMSIDQIITCIKEVNIAFLYAPLFHPALKKLSPIRKKMGIPTLFNLLGPLLNPAKAEHILIGVAHESMLEQVSEVVLQMKRVKSALVFHGSGLDELSTLGKITAYKIKDDQKQKIEIDPIALGFKPCSLEDLQGGDAEKNAALLIDALAGKNLAIADALILNAGAALMVYGKVSSLKEGIDTARDVIKQGKALELLTQWMKFSNTVIGSAHHE